MTVKYGPNLGLLEGAALGEGHFSDLKKFLRGVDGLVQLQVLDKDLAAPPGSPADGDRYIIAASPTGAWSGKAGQIARWTTDGNAWEFYPPKSGWRATCADEADMLYQHDGSAWVGVYFGYLTNGIIDVIQRNAQGAVIVDMGGNDYYLTEQESQHQIVFLTNTGTGKTCYLYDSVLNPALITVCNLSYEVGFSCCAGGVVINVQPFATHQLAYTYTTAVQLDYARKDSGTGHLIDPIDAGLVVDDSTHRFVTDAEKSTWNEKQNALGYTPLNAASNLSDVTSASTARTNLGLGTLATQSGTFSSISPKDFGAANDGTTDDTVALKACFDYAIPLGKSVDLEGAYLVSGTIQPFATVAAGEMHIRCRGDVVINVSASSTAFRDLLFCQTTAANNGSITGGSLKINCNNKAASGITFSHLASGMSGKVNVSCPVEVINCYNNDAASTYDNQGILVNGNYSEVIINQPIVDTVSRVASGGVCSGIRVIGFEGIVTINQPKVSNVLVGGGTDDANGIYVIGKIIGASSNETGGEVFINEPVFVDNKARSLKSFCSKTTVFRPRVFRKYVVSTTSSIDFDFQIGGGLLIEPTFEYSLNGGVTPLGASHIPVCFQQVCDNAVMRSKSVGGVLKTEAAMPRYCVTIHQSSSFYSETEVSGLRVIPTGSFATTAFTSAILETRMDTIVAKSTKTRLIVRDVSGPIQCYGIGYTNYSSGAASSKLSVVVTDLFNTLGASSSTKAFNNLSGSFLTAVETFLFRNNYGIRDLYLGGWTFNFNALVPGCIFTADIGAITATNAPPSWGASGYATIECLSDYFGSTDRTVRVTVGNATAANTVFHTQNGGTTWGTIK